VTPRRPRIPEKVVEVAVIRAFTAFGCHVYKLSQPRHTMQTPGLPDLYVLAPKVHRAFWFEVKAAGGTLRESQHAFKCAAEACDVTVIVGGLAEARHQLEHLGLALKDGRMAA
jgi:hypothetical protein